MLGGRDDKSSAAAALAHKEHGVPLQLSDRLAGRSAVPVIPPQVVQLVDGE